MSVWQDDHDVKRAALIAWSPPKLPPRSDASLLHQQIEQLADLMTPTREECALRAAVISRVAAIVHAAEPNTSAFLPYGSSATALALPGAALDLHAAVPGVPSSTKSLNRIRQRIKRGGFAVEGSLEPKNSQVPTVSFVDGESGLRVNISVNTHAPQASAIVCRTLQVHLPPPPLSVLSVPSPVSVLSAGSGRAASARARVQVPICAVGSEQQCFRRHLLSSHLRARPCTRARVRTSTPARRGVRRDQWRACMLI